MLVCVDVVRTCYNPKKTGVHTKSLQPKESREIHQLICVLRYQTLKSAKFRFLKSARSLVESIKYYLDEGLGADPLLTCWLLG